ncbi:hypothetical protein ACFLVE_03080 [Chloroflexota bacterium]
MKHNRIIRIATSLMALFLLMLMVPTTRVLAADGYISVSPDWGEVNDRIEIEGYGFDPGEYVFIFFSSYEADEGDDVNDLDAYEYVGYDRTGYTDAPDEGAFEKSVNVPSRLTEGETRENVAAGIYYIYVSYDSGGSNIVDSDEFTVSGIELYPTQGNVGDKVEITGAGFRPKRNIEVFYDGDDIDIESGDTMTNLRGEFTSFIIVPAPTIGEYYVQVEIDDDEAEAEFTVLSETATTDEPSADEGFASIAPFLQTAYGYMAGEGTKGWTIYNPLWPSELNSLKTLYVARGYWIYVHQPCALLYGSRIYVLNAGWNLIGWIPQP